ncbi:MAG: PIN domain-containing protein [Deltaproteobacteria bacterium]|nr:PIN domain-containing protein [Deltaproteobacteria bacterium]
MRVVFDTNVLVSALVFPDGRADAAVRRIIEGKDDLILSTDILAEVLSVLARKFGRDKEELSRVAVILSEMAAVSSNAPLRGRQPQSSPATRRCWLSASMRVSD